MFEARNSQLSCYLYLSGFQTVGHCLNRRTVFPMDFSSPFHLNPREENLLQNLLSLSLFPEDGQSGAPHWVTLQSRYDPSSTSNPFSRCVSLRTAGAAQTRLVCAPDPRSWPVSGLRPRHISIGPKV